MIDLVFYCRAGYETDLLGELQDQLAAKQMYGYASFKKHDAMLRFHLNNDSDQANRKLKTKNTTLLTSITELNNKLPKLENLVFARQKLFVLTDIEFTTDNRVSEIAEYLNEYHHGATFDDVLVEYAENEESKKIAKFCKKFLVPLRAALRNENVLNSKVCKSHVPMRLHLLFKTSAKCTVSISMVHDSSSSYMGIKRLKMPTAAPSRSTLKLEEAIHLFFDKNQRETLFCAGMRAADLGACPGGWTYQLISRNINVEAVDHGEIADNLLQTGLVEYYAQNGFLYEPQQGNVDWLVCDMLEQPTRVAELMLKWLTSRKANAALFNLKLPMSKRYRVVKSILANIKETLAAEFDDYHLAAKHLYHNRDEISIVIITNSQMVSVVSSSKQ